MPIFAHSSITGKVYVEYSNEVWNGAFSAYRHAASMARVLGLNGASGEDGQGHLRYYGYRARQIFSIFRVRSWGLGSDVGGRGLSSVESHERLNISSLSSGSGVCLLHLHARACARVPNLLRPARALCLILTRCLPAAARRTCGAALPPPGWCGWWRCRRARATQRCVRWGRATRTPWPSPPTSTWTRPSCWWVRPFQFPMIMLY